MYEVGLRIVFLGAFGALLAMMLVLIVYGIVSVIANRFNGQTVSTRSGAGWVRVTVSPVGKTVVQTEDGWQDDERSRVVAELRDLCAEFGDNDWTEDDDLADVIENHLTERLNQMTMRMPAEQVA